MPICQSKRPTAGSLSTFAIGKLLVAPDSLHPQAFAQRGRYPCTDAV